MISSTQNQQIKAHKKLQQKKYRVKEQKLLIEGEHLLQEAKKKGLLISTYHQKPHPEYKEGTIVSPHVMKYLTAAKTPPLDAGVAKISPPKTMDDKVLILENIQDPGNVGTLLRSALAFGFNSVIIDESADPYSQKVLRSTQGAIFSLNLHFLDVKTFKQKYPHALYGAHLAPQKKARKKPTPPYAIILGNEGSGLTPSTVELLDHTLTIPIDSIDSLNVAVAGSIIMHSIAMKQSLFTG